MEAAFTTIGHIIGTVIAIMILVAAGGLLLLAAKYLVKFIQAVWKI